MSACLGLSYPVGLGRVTLQLPRLPAIATSACGPLAHAAYERSCSQARSQTRSILHNAKSRSFHTMPIRLLKTARPPESRPQAWDAEIPATWVQIIDPQTNRPGEPRRLKYVLQSLNKDYRVVCQQNIPATVPADWMPMCKIVTKAQAFQDQKASLQKEKDSKKITGNKPRTIEINWAIEKHDLEVRLGRLRDFLTDGKRVEILLARKKKSRAATPGECKALMDTMEAELEAIGAKQVVARQGEVGGLVKMAVEVPAIPKK